MSYCIIELPFHFKFNTTRKVHKLLCYKNSTHMHAPPKKKKKSNLLCSPQTQHPVHSLQLKDNKPVHLQGTAYQQTMLRKITFLQIINLRVNGEYNQNYMDDFKVIAPRNKLTKFHLSYLKKEIMPLI